MLEPARLHWEQIRNGFILRQYDDDYFFCTHSVHERRIPDPNEDRGEFRFAIIDKDPNDGEAKVVGYFRYYLCILEDAVYGIQALSFVPKEKHPCIGLDVYREVTKLIHTHNKVNFSCLDTAPAVHLYDRLCEKYKGRKIVYHEDVMDNHRVFHDKYEYEIFNPYHPKYGCKGQYFQKKLIGG